MYRMKVYLVLNKSGNRDSRQEELFNHKLYEKHKVQATF